MLLNLWKCCEWTSWNERYVSFITEHLVNRTKGFDERTSRTNLNCEFQKKKRKSKAFEIWKEDRQVFGLLVGRAFNIKQAQQMLSYKKVSNDEMWLIDEIASIRALKLWKAYSKFTDSVLRFIIPPLELDNLMVEVINDVYLVTFTNAGILMPEVQVVYL